MYFNPRAPYGARPPVPKFLVTLIKFQSTCPVRGTTRRSDAAHAVRHFNPRAPYGARHRKEVDGELPRHISIHVPRTGHDGEGLEEVVSDVLISIHVPRTGHDREDMIHEDVAYCISIHVPRTGHDAALKQAQVRAEISIHVPRTGHDVTRGYITQDEYISIHVPRTGHDPYGGGRKCSLCNFNPRAPYGARQGVRR